MYPKDLLYTKDHEWLKQEKEDRVRIGITYYAQQELGDIVFLELPEEGSEIAVGEGLAVIESVKAVSDINSPVSGTIIEVNKDIEERPESLNEEPYKTWIVVIVPSDSSELDTLLTQSEYLDHIGEG